MNDDERNDWSQARPITRVVPDLLLEDTADLKRVIEHWPEKMQKAYRRSQDPDDAAALAGAATIIVESGAPDLTIASKPIIKAWERVTGSKHRLGDIRTVRLLADGGMLPDHDELSRLAEHENGEQTAVDEAEKIHKRMATAARKGKEPPEIIEASVRADRQRIDALRAKSERERRRLEAVLATDHPLTSVGKVFLARRRMVVQMLVSDLLALKPSLTRPNITACAILAAYLPKDFPFPPLDKDSRYIARVIATRRAHPAMRMTDDEKAARLLGMISPRQEHSKKPK